MRRIPLVVCLLSIASLPLGASAQPRLAPGGGLRLDPNGSSSTVTSTTESSSATESSPSSATAESPSAAPAPAPGPVAEPTPYDEEEAPELRASEAQAEEEGALEAEAVPADADRLLEQAAPQENDPLRAQWTSPQRTFTIHGYMRMRTWLMDNYSLSRTHDVGQTDGRQYYPFQYFIPVERGATVDGSTCGSTCYSGSKQYRYGDMRLRLTPTIALSDEIRVHAMVDLFDNMVLGSTPDTGSVYGSNVPSGYPSGVYPGVPVDSFSLTQLTPATGRNSFQNSIAIRRAWAEIGNHSIGQLRFGRMGNHWGLGMLWNDGRGLDADYQTDVDRIMGITKWKGFTFGAAWDFANSGVVNYQTWHLGLPYDPSTKDNLHQFMLFAGHRLEADEQRRRLEAGRWVLNGGVYFQFQSQTLSYVPNAQNNISNNSVCNSALPQGSANPPVPGSQTTVDEACLRGAGVTNTFFNRDTSLFTVDGWGQFLWREFRAELEIAMRFGGLSIQSTPGSATATHYGVRQIGYAFESEYHLLQHKLGVYFNQGYATGDSNVVGLSTREDHVTQTAAGNGSGTVTTFAFHPNYRIDLILFRTILGQVAGVTYFKPGISYDIIHTDYGRVLGARIDAIYSRANRAPQAYGDASSLGFEIDSTLYYRTEDGPDLLDGVYLGANYGILIPLSGLGYIPSQLAGASDKIKPAMVFRVLMGVQF